jgi:tRNA pseudouridine55 synthase
VPPARRSRLATPTPTGSDRRAVNEGLVVVDKPGDWTSHDVVARVRRIAGTRRVGHAGTLDPMATGVLIVGVGRATRLLGYLARDDKDYLASIRLGASTTTDDAEGEVLEISDAGSVTDAMVLAEMGALSGEIEQVPSAVSAIKIDGVRSYARVRAGNEVALAARPVRVDRFELLRRDADHLEVAVTCSTGTYVRALARDLGRALGVGAHLTALRRTRVGRFGLDRARTLDALEADFSAVPLAAAVDSAFARVDVSDEEARRIGHGQRLTLALPASPTGVFAPDGRVVALVEDRDGLAQPLCVFE